MGVTNTVSTIIHMAQLQDKKIGFKTVQLFKDQILGIGSYGKVCKAECDDLVCAAKLIHETLFHPTQARRQIAPQQENRLPMRRFEQECEFMSTIRHPNIVQYLGMYQDPGTDLPVLLMELMDDSLTHFLESSLQPIPYHIQVNICHDIILALSFLHSNGIIHRDLSGNNVLMISNVRAKVTDFGMARLGDLNPQATHLTGIFTMCPGTDVYMPPEAVKDEPVYSEKIDCFSFGVITIQILTRQFPKPGRRRKEIEIDHVGLVEKCISEYERRQNHIGVIEPNHPLLPVALCCLKDKDIERPSAHQLCEAVAPLKETHEYSESLKAAQKGSTPENGAKQNQNDEAIPAGLNKIQLFRKQHREEAWQLDREKEQIIEGKERELKCVKQQLKVCEQARFDLEKRISELELQLSPRRDQPRAQTQHPEARSKEESKVNVKLTWKEGKRAPHKMSSPFNAAVDGSVMYLRTDTHICAYTASNSTCLLYTSPSPRDATLSRMPSSA